MKIKSDKILDDGKKLIVFIVILFVALKILFFKEGFVNIALLTLGISFVLIVPGYLLSSLVFDAGFGERLILGAVIMIGLTGVLSYYLGLIFGNIFYFYGVLVVFILILIYLNYVKNHQSQTGGIKRSFTLRHKS